MVVLDKELGPRFHVYNGLENRIVPDLRKMAHVRGWPWNGTKTMIRRAGTTCMGSENRTGGRDLRIFFHTVTCRCSKKVISKSMNEFKILIYEGPLKGGYMQKKLQNWQNPKLFFTDQSSENKSDTISCTQEYQISSVKVLRTSSPSIVTDLLEEIGKICLGSIPKSRFEFRIFLFSLHYMDTELTR